MTIRLSITERTHQHFLGQLATPHTVRVHTACIVRESYRGRIVQLLAEGTGFTAEDAIADARAAFKATR